MTQPDSEFDHDQPLETWVRFFVWLVIGLFIYFLYSRKRVET